MVDLHLFLGRPLVEAQKNSEAQDDGLFGSVPQTIIDAEQNFLKTAHDKSHGLVGLVIYHERHYHHHRHHCYHYEAKRFLSANNFLTNFHRIILAAVGAT